MPQHRLIVALDVDNWERARYLVSLLAGVVGGFKVGFRLFYQVGPETLTYLRGTGREVFADLKLHDLPTTVAGGIRALAKHGATMINVHAAGGKTMMQAAREAAEQAAAAGSMPRPKVLAVTVLTSIDDRILRHELGVPEPVSERVVRWACLAKECGLDGVVASPREASEVRRACGPDFLIVTPGIRPSGMPAEDQRRVMTPAAAVRAGADYIIMGRPIITAPDPRRAVEEVIASLP